MNPHPSLLSRTVLTCLPILGLMAKQNILCHVLYVKESTQIII